MICGGSPRGLTVVVYTRSRVPIRRPVHPGRALARCLRSMAWCLPIRRSCGEMVWSHRDEIQLCFDVLSEGRTWLTPCVPETNRTWAGGHEKQSMALRILFNRNTGHEHSILCALLHRQMLSTHQASGLQDDLVASLGRNPRLTTDNGAHWRVTSA